VLEDRFFRSHSIMKTIVVTALALTAFAAPVLAQDAPMRGGPAPVARADMEAKLRARLATVDANRDGMVTRDEMRAAGQAKKAERRAKAFARLDANSDGVVSRDEFTNAQAGAGQRAAGMQRMKMMRRMGAARMGAARAGAMAALADKDGRIAIDAAVKAALARFDAADANRDGRLTPEERRAARDARRATRG
jgi:Ca2+-binding EF-hand superfamily protein